MVDLSALFTVLSCKGPRGSERIDEHSESIRYRTSTTLNRTDRTIRTIKTAFRQAGANGSTSEASQSATAQAQHPNRTIRTDRTDKTTMTAFQKAASTTNQPKKAYYLLFIGKIY